MNPRHPQLRTASPRSRARAGSAFIEALVVMLLFCVLFGCAMLFGHGYGARILAGQRSRAAAWTQTSGGCDDPDRRLLLAAEGLADAPNQRNAQLVMNALDAGLQRAPHAPSSGRWTGSLPWGDHPRDVALEIRTLFTCNELPATRAHADETAASRHWLTRMLSQVKR